MNRIGYLKRFTGVNRFFEKTKVVVPTMLFAAILVAGNAWAQARKTSISCNSDSAGDVTVSFKISGVGNGNLCVVSAGTYGADCACKNGGGNCPSAANKQSTTDAVGAGQAFQSTNGQILAQLITPAPVSVQVFGPGDFTQSGNACTPNNNAIPVRSGTCTTKAQAIVFNRQCAALF